MIISEFYGRPAGLNGSQALNSLWHITLTLLLMFTVRYTGCALHVQSCMVQWRCSFVLQGAGRPAVQCAQLGRIGSIAGTGVAEHAPRVQAAVQYRRVSQLCAPCQCAPAGRCHQRPLPVLDSSCQFLTALLRCRLNDPNGLVCIDGLYHMCVPKCL